MRLLFSHIDTRAYIYKLEGIMKTAVEIDLGVKL
jgi:hypothetical protein